MGKWLIMLALSGLGAGPGEFTISRDFMTMPDGVRLSVTWYRPDTPEKVPVLLEMLPYRKDDMFYQRDYPLYSYFARRGYAVLKVDVRGTGSSQGTLPPYEYSEQEIQDALEVIDQASRQPWCNGRVGMFGISWSGFNALQVALRNPPALKAILALHASDDLYHDDVHYHDGVLHYDEYHLEINRDNALPDSLDYRLDEAYFRDRFDREPWFFTYLRHQLDGPFWRQRSQRFRPGALKIPAYMIGGLWDFYRDAPLRVLASAPVVKVEIGPWNHDWPDVGEPGPNYEWRSRALEWWDYWLKDRGPRPDLTPLIYQRGADWRQEPWPIEGTTWQTFYPTRAGLGDVPGKGELELVYQPGQGARAGLWWGDQTDDMALDDGPGALVFDSPPLAESTPLIGFPRVHLRARCSAPLAHWSARLEDVSPDGRVELLTGVVLNGSQRRSRLHPEPLGGGDEDFPLELHFTTWTFAPAHRIRLALSNAQFPMAWATPDPMTSHLVLGPETRLELPIVPPARKVPTLPPPEPREQRTDAVTLPSRGMPFRFDKQPGRVVWEGDDAFAIKERSYQVWEKLTFRPGHTRGESSVEIHLEQGRTLRLEVTMEIRSDHDNFYGLFVRKLFENGRLVREKTFQDQFPRAFQ